MIAFPGRRQFGHAGPGSESRDLDGERLRRHMIAQTQAFINDALTHPELATVIPTVPVGSGCFPKSWSRYFWHRVLGGVGIDD